MIFYADILATSETTLTVNLAIDAPSFSVAVAMANSWCEGATAASGPYRYSVSSLVSGSKPRGRTYFAMNDFDAIRKGLKL